MSKNNISFILHKPQLSENIGACARAIKNFNFKKLVLINPKPIFPNDKILATSVGAKDIIKQSNNYDIGFKWNGTEYQMVTDLMFWSQDYSVDKFLNKINQRYAYNAILNLSGKENFQIKRSENLENGSVRVLLERFN